MPIVVEPTPGLSQRIEQLPEPQATRLWSALEKANQHLARLVSRLESRHKGEPEQRRLERLALDIVARTWELRPEHLISADRYRRRVAARGQLISLLHERHGLSYRTIARLLRRDRSTVAHAHRQHHARLAGRMPAEADYAVRYQQVLSLCPPPSVN